MIDLVNRDVIATAVSAADAAASNATTAADIAFAAATAVAHAPMSAALIGAAYWAYVEFAAAAQAAADAATRVAGAYVACMDKPSTVPVPIVTDHQALEHRLDAIEARLDTDADALAVQLARALSEQATLRARLSLLEGRIDGLSSWLAKLAGTVRDMNAPGRLEALEWFREQVEASLFPVTE